ncbi:response regulator transcription factor [Larkinella soli]
MTSREIADHLSISYHTVRTHRKNIMAKLEKRTTPELIHFTLSHGLIT